MIGNKTPIDPLTSSMFSSQTTLTYIHDDNDKVPGSVLIEFDKTNLFSNIKIYYLCKKWAINYCKRNKKKNILDTIF